MSSARPIDSRPPPSLEELSSFEIRLAKGSVTDSECRNWLSRMIAAYRDLHPGDGERETKAPSLPRGNG